MILVDHVDPEPLVDVQKVVVDIGQRLILLLQRLEQHGFRLEEAAGHDGVGHALQHETPSRGVGPGVRRAQEDQAKGRDEDGAIVLVVRGFHVVGVEERALDQDASEAVADPDDGVPVGAFALAEHGEVGDEGLGVLVDEVVARAAVVLPRVHIGVVSVGEDVGLGAAKGRG